MTSCTWEDIILLHQLAKTTGMTRQSTVDSAVVPCDGGAVCCMKENVQHITIYYKINFQRVTFLLNHSLVTLEALWALI